MEESVRHAIEQAVEREPFARALDMKLVALDQGYSAVEMTYTPSSMANIYERAHGGAIFALIDEAFETAGQTDGTIAVALNVNVTYVSSPGAGARLRAEARMVSQTKRTANYDIRVTDQAGELIASCQALAYRTGKRIPFLEWDRFEIYCLSTTSLICPDNPTVRSGLPACFELVEGLSGWPV